MALKYPKMSKQGTSGQKKYITLKIPRKVEVWKRPELHGAYGFIQHGIINCLLHKEREGPIMIIYGLKWRCEGPFQVTDDIETA